VLTLDPKPKEVVIVLESLIVGVAVIGEDEALSVDEVIDSSVLVAGNVMLDKVLLVIGL
jgi:hypothetical protein